jgi:aldose 1-epimerase
MDPVADARTRRIRLEAGRAAVEIAPDVGGRVAALEVDGWDLIRRDGWTDMEWGSFVMAPWVGRLRNGRVRWRGRAWDMPLTEPPHALHGTVLDVPWDVVETTPTMVRLETGLGPHWPFGGRAVRALELNPGRLIDRLEIHAVEEPFPAIVGWHPWFRRRAARLADQVETGPVTLDIRAGRRVDVDLEGLPTGWLVDPRPQPVDDVLLDVAEPPVVGWPGGPELTLHAPDAAAWVVYAAHPDGVCVEPLTGLPDGLNRGRLGDPPVAEPGRPLVATFEIRW